MVYTARYGSQSHSPEVPMLTLRLPSPDLLFDQLLPEGLTSLPQDLAQIDQLLSDPAFLAPFRAHFAAETAAQRKKNTLHHGRPTIPMATYLRLMAVKHRTGWGYETLLREVSDSFHLRRFCLIPITGTLPDESTIRKLTRRLGPEVVDQLIRAAIAKAIKERRFRPRALRSDSTVVEADIRHPSDAGLCADAVRVLTRAGRKLVAAVPGVRERVRDRSRSVQKTLRELGRSLTRRSGEAKQAVQRLTEKAAGAVRASITEAEKLLAAVRRCAQPSPSESGESFPDSPAIANLEHLISLAKRVLEQVRMRFAGEKITNRLVSLFDRDARPVRRGKLAKPTEFGYVFQLTEITQNTRRRTPSLVLPPKGAAGSTHENTLFVDSAAELSLLGITKLKEASFDAGFLRAKTEEALAPAGNPSVFIARSQDNAGSPWTTRRRARFRVGCEGRIAHLKREYDAGRSRLKGEVGAHIWESWAVLAYDLDTIAPMPAKPRTKSPG